MNERTPSGNTARLSSCNEALEQIVEPADAIPAIAVVLRKQDMLAAPTGTAVVLGQQVDQELADVAIESEISREKAREGILPPTANNVADWILLAAAITPSEERRPGIPLGVGRRC
jgi:hypothetical protein